MFKRKIVESIAIMKIAFSTRIQDCYLYRCQLQLMMYSFSPAFLFVFSVHIFGQLGSFLITNGCWRCFRVAPYTTDLSWNLYSRKKSLRRANYVHWLQHPVFCRKVLESGSRLSAQLYSDCKLFFVDCGFGDNPRVRPQTNFNPKKSSVDKSIGVC